MAGGSPQQFRSRPHPPPPATLPCRMSFMTVCSTTSSYVFSTRMNLAKSSKISSWNRGSSCRSGAGG